VQCSERTCVRGLVGQYALKRVSIEKQRLVQRQPSGQFLSQRETPETHGSLSGQTRWIQRIVQSPLAMTTIFALEKWSESGNHWASGSTDATVQVWSFADGHRSHRSILFSLVTVNDPLVTRGADALDQR
jgi:hypothetical protein